MPYKKTYKRRPVRRYKKGYKRFYKKFKKTSYDGAVFMKINLIGNITNDVGYGHGDLTVNWAGNSVTAANASVRLYDAQEWGTYKDLYSEYRVLGVKIKLFPISEATGSTGSGLY